MKAHRDPKAYSLRDSPAVLRWGVLIAASATLIALAELLHLPAAAFLGAMLGAILVAATEGTVTLPPGLWPIAQGFVGCLVARSIDPGIFPTILAHWPIFLICVGTVIVFGTAIGALLAFWKILPGTTAVWGSSPGAATVMVLLAQAYGGDIRLVAFMQFLRMVLVAAVASVVARLWVGVTGASTVAQPWFPTIAPGPFAATVALALIGAVVGKRLRIPGGQILVPMFVGIALSMSHAVVITLPLWLMTGCYVVVGWFVGLQFTREIVIYAARKSPQILASIFVLISLCGGLAFALHLVVGMDALTAYLATSPGGLDSVAIIAASAHVDVSFVMAMQIVRFMVVLACGPAIARAVARRVADEPAPP